MGCPTTDYSTTYAPNVNQSKDLSINPGVTSPEMMKLINQLNSSYSGQGGMSQEIAEMRRENRDLREKANDMFDGGPNSRVDNRSGRLPDDRSSFHADDRSNNGTDDGDFGGNENSGSSRSVRMSLSMEVTNGPEGKSRDDESSSSSEESSRSTNRSVDSRQNDRLSALEKELSGDATSNSSEGTKTRSKRSTSTDCEGASCENKSSDTKASSSKNDRSSLSKTDSGQNKTLDRLEKELEQSDEPTSGIDAKQDERIAAIEKKLAERNGKSASDVDSKQNTKLAELEKKLGLSGPDGEDSKAGKSDQAKFGMDQKTTELLKDLGDALKPALSKTTEGKKLLADFNKEVDKLANPESKVNTKQDDRIAALEKKLAGNVDKSVNSVDVKQNDKLSELEKNLGIKDTAKDGEATKGTDPNKGSKSEKPNTETAYDKKQNDRMANFEETLRRMGVQLPKAETNGVGDNAQDVRIKQYISTMNDLKMREMKEPTSYDKEQDFMMTFMEETLAESRMARGV